MLENRNVWTMGKLYFFNFHQQIYILIDFYRNILSFSVFPKKKIEYKNFCWHFFLFPSSFSVHSYGFDVYDFTSPFIFTISTYTLHFALSSLHSPNQIENVCSLEIEIFPICINFKLRNSIKVVMESVRICSNIFFKKSNFLGLRKIFINHLTFLYTFFVVMLPVL